MISRLIWFDRKALMVWSQWMYTINKKWLGTCEAHQNICMHACAVWTLSISHVLRQVRVGLNVSGVHFCLPSRIWSSIQEEFNWCRRRSRLIVRWKQFGANTCPDQVFSLQPYLTGDRIYNFVPHDRKNHFSLLHVPHFIIIIIIF